MDGSKPMKLPYSGGFIHIHYSNHHYPSTIILGVGARVPRVPQDSWLPSWAGNSTEACSTWSKVGGDAVDRWDAVYCCVTYYNGDRLTVTVCSTSLVNSRQTLELAKYVSTYF